MQKKKVYVSTSEWDVVRKNPSLEVGGAMVLGKLPVPWGPTNLD